MLVRNKESQITLENGRRIPFALLGITTKEVLQHENETVHFQGWAYHVRVARKTLIFVELRDGSGYCQCVVFGKELCEESQVKRLTRECTTDVVGELNASEGKTDPHDIADVLPLGLMVKAWRVIGTRRLRWRTSSTRTRSHIGCRTGTLSSVSSDQHVLKIRSEICHEFSEFYHNHDFTETFRPTIVMTQRERCRRFSSWRLQRSAYLTQSSQLNLESVIAALGPALGMLSINRAEPSRTVRLRSEYQPRGVPPFISFDDPLNHTDDLVCPVVDNNPRSRRQDPQDEPVVRVADAAVPPDDTRGRDHHFNEHRPSTRGSCLSLARTPRRSRSARRRAWSGARSS